MTGFECDICGLAECDLPDGFDPEPFFEREGGKTWCVVHADQDVRAILEDAEGEQL